MMSSLPLEGAQFLEFSLEKMAELEYAGVVASNGGL